MDLKSYIPKLSLNDNQKMSINDFEKKFLKKYVDVDCINCGSQKYMNIYNDDRYGLVSYTNICIDCGLLLQSPRLKDTDLELFYKNDFYRKIYMNNKSIEEYYNEKINLHNKSFDLFFDTLDISFEKIADIGCGTGRETHYFLNKGKDIIGLEPSHELVNLANRDGYNHIKQGFVKDLKHEVDLVIMNNVFEHLDKPDKDLIHLKKYTKYLYIQVPGNIIRMQSIQNAHNYYFSINTLTKLMSKHGFKKIKAYYFSGQIYSLFINSDEKFINFKYSKNVEIIRVLTSYYLQYFLYFLRMIKKYFKFKFKNFNTNL